MKKNLSGKEKIELMKNMSALSVILLNSDGVMVFEGLCEGVKKHIKIENENLNDDQLALTIYKLCPKVDVAYTIFMQNKEVFKKRENILEILKDTFLHYLPYTLYDYDKDTEIGVLWLKRAIEMDIKTNKATHLSFMGNFLPDILKDDESIWALREEMVYLKKAYKNEDYIGNDLYNLLERFNELEKMEREKELKQTIGEIEKINIQRTKNKI